MPQRLEDVAEELRAARKRTDAISDASRETLPYTRRITDALGALRALVSDRTPVEQLESDLHTALERRQLRAVGGADAQLQLRATNFNA